MAKRLISAVLAVLLCLMVPAAAFADPDVAVDYDETVAVAVAAADGDAEDTDGTAAAIEASDDAAVVPDASDRTGDTSDADMQTIVDEPSVEDRSDANEPAEPESGVDPAAEPAADASSEPADEPSSAELMAITPQAMEPMSAIDQLAADNKDVIADGTYYISSNVSRFSVLDIEWASKKDGGNLQIWGWNGCKNQQWKVTHDSKGYIILTNVNSGKVLDVAWAKTDEGTNVTQFRSKGTAAQKWIAVPRSDGSVDLISALSKNRALDVAWGSSADGTNVRIWSRNGCLSQGFRFCAANPSVAPGEDLGLSGWYTIGLATNTAYKLDVSGMGTANGTNVQLYKQNGTCAQLFQFIYVDGYYLIRAARSGKALDVDFGRPLRGTNVQIWDANKENANQLFAARTNSDGSVTFINKATGLALAVSGGKAANATNVILWTDTSPKSQRFVLTKVTEPIPIGMQSIAIAGTNQRIDVVNASWEEGKNVQVYAANDTLAQRWFVSKVPGKTNTYTLEAPCSGKLLTEDSNGNICTREATGGPEQEWTGGVGYGGMYLKNVASGHVLGTAKGSSGNGTNVQADGSAISGKDGKGKGLLFSTAAPLGDGYYYIKLPSDYGRVLDLKNPPASDGTQIRLSQFNGSAAQRWLVTRQSDGTYKIINGASGKALDIDSGKMADGTKVQQWGIYDTANQKWKVTYVAGEGYRFAAAADSSYVLSTKGNSDASGALSVIQKDTGAMGQRYIVEMVSPPMTADQKKMNERAQGFSSATNWLILVDCTTNHTGVFQGSKGKWSMVYYWECCTGAPESPTVKGEYTVGMKGYSFGGGYTCYYYTQFYGNYLFHSQKYKQGTFDILDGSMGVNVSEGCVRLYLDRAKWIYDNIPQNTKVFVY